MAQPITRLAAPLGGAVEPLVHAPEAVQSARKSRIGMIDDAVFEDKRAHARPLPRIGGHRCAGHGGALRSPIGCRARAYLGPFPVTHPRRRRALIVVVNGPVPLLLLGD